MLQTLSYFLVGICTVLNTVRRDYGLCNLTDARLRVL